MYRCEAFLSSSKKESSLTGNSLFRDSVGIRTQEPVRFGWRKKKRAPLLETLFRDSVGIRTQDPQLRRLLLYPTELRNQHPYAVCGCKGTKKIANVETFSSLFVFFYEGIGTLVAEFLGFAECLQGFGLLFQLAVGNAFHDIWVGIVGFELDT